MNLDDQATQPFQGKGIKLSGQIVKEDTTQVTSTLFMPKAHNAMTAIEKAEGFE